MYMQPPTVKQWLSRSVLDIMVKRKRLDLIDILIKSGAKIDHVDKMKR